MPSAATPCHDRANAMLAFAARFTVTSARMHPAMRSHDLPTSSSLSLLVVVVRVLEAVAP